MYLAIPVRAWVCYLHTHLYIAAWWCCWTQDYQTWLSYTSVVSFKARNEQQVWMMMSSSDGLKNESYGSVWREGYIVLYTACSLCSRRLMRRSETRSPIVVLYMSKVHSSSSPRWTVEGVGDLPVGRLDDALSTMAMSCYVKTANESECMQRCKERVALKQAGTPRDRRRESYLWADQRDVCVTPGRQAGTAIDNDTWNCNYVSK